MLETKPEPEDGHRERTVRLLTYVLNYDDLGQDHSCQFRLSKPTLPLTIGRANSTDKPPHIAGTQLLIPDGFMSGTHARIEIRGGAAIVSDTNSRNGTWVNGRRITEHRLSDGDLIEVGHALLCYRSANEAVVDALSHCGDKPCLGPTRTLCPEQAALGVALGKIGPSSEPVLILAETGSGKEEAARAIHELSARKGNFRAVDCGATPENLFESTFFGHRKGAFTGAEQDRTGEIVQANNGTLFLDEVGNMTVACQAKLLRTMESNEVTAVGATRKADVDVRWLAATNVDLFAAGDTFREDLLRRLAGYVARIPPLRKRREDLGILSAYLLAQAGVTTASIAPAAARKLFCDTFVGNIRQLRANLRSATLLAGDAQITMAHLPAETLRTNAGSNAGTEPAPGATPVAAPTAKAKSTRTGTPTVEEVTVALHETSGNVVQAAENLGTHPRQVYRWIERFSLNLDDYRS